MKTDEGPRRHFHLLALAVSGLMAVGAVSSAAAQAPGRDISGFWELRDDSKKVAAAPLTQAARDRLAAERAEADRTAAAQGPQAGPSITFASRWCHPLGTPFIMGDSAPLDILQHPRETVITAEVQSAARHIYTDGRGHVPADEFDPTTNGHSIGKWEGDAFVVDTVGFSERGNPGVPGGGRRGPTSHLVERYRLLDGGERLSVTFTWTDPSWYERPHTYEFIYYKAPPESYALEYFCDASDPDRTSGVGIDIPQ